MKREFRSTEYTKEEIKKLREEVENELSLEK